MVRNSRKRIAFFEAVSRYPRTDLVRPTTLSNASKTCAIVGIVSIVVGGSKLMQDRVSERSHTREREGEREGVLTVRCEL